MMIMRSQVAKSLNRVDQLVLLIAALCHDVDHDGASCKSLRIACALSLPCQVVNVLHTTHMMIMRSQIAKISVE